MQDIVRHTYIGYRHAHLPKALVTSVLQRCSHVNTFVPIQYMCSILFCLLHQVIALTLTLPQTCIICLHEQAGTRVLSFTTHRFFSRYLGERRNNSKDDRVESETHTPNYMTWL